MRLIAFLGPDGTGKSSVVEEVSARLETSGMEVEIYHTRPLLGRRANTNPVTEPHALPPRGCLLSLLQSLYWLGDLWMWFLLERIKEINGFRPRTRLTIFDRYVHDLAVDPRRVRFGGGRKLALWTARMAPRPVRVIVLCAPVDVIRSRKVEVPYDETQRQVNEYQNLCSGLDRCHVIDASQPVEAVVDDVLHLIASE